MLYLANDQHHKQITVSLRDEAGQVLVRRQVSTRPDRIRGFLEDVRTRAGREGFMAIVEVCGFNDWFLELLRESGCREIVLLQPGKQSKRKTDRRDADALGQLLWVNRERLRRGERPQGLRRVVIPTRREQEERQLTAARQRAGRRRTQIVNALQRILRKHNLQHQQPTKGFDTQAVRRWLRQLPLPAVDRLELEQLLAQWELLDRQVVELERMIADRAAESDEARLLMTIKGLSPYGTLGLAARIGDVQRFPRPRSLANYFGPHSGLSQLRREAGPAGVDHQGGEPVRAVHARATGAACPQARRVDAGLVPADQVATRLQDRPRGSDAPAVHDPLAHADPPRACLLRLDADQDGAIRLEEAGRLRR
jgi:transposase